jgi:hypothetical protein
MFHKQFLKVVHLIIIIRILRCTCIIMVELMRQFLGCEKYELLPFLRRYLTLHRARSNLEVCKACVCVTFLGGSFVRNSLLVSP